MKNNKIRKTAIHFNQNDSSLTVLSLTANELISNTRVDRFNSNLELSDEENGYQRPATPSRVKKLGNTLHKNTIDEKDFPMPTAILLSDRNAKITYGEGYVEFDINDRLPVIDGQHRVAGLKYAIEEKHNEILGDYEYPVVIMHELDKLKEMNQFSIVNSTAKSVNTALVNFQLATIQEALGDGEIGENERWKVIASKVLRILNNDENSIWFERVLMPDQNKYTKTEINEEPSRAKKRITTATSFMVSLRPVISYAESKIVAGKTIDEKVRIIASIVKAWWEALNVLMPAAFEDPSGYVIQKTAGIFSLHKLLQTKLIAAHVARLRYQNSEEYIRMLEGGYNCMNSLFWSSDENEEMAEARQYGSMAGFKEIYVLMNDELETPLNG
jgi:DGQHR domain-containing protein